MTLWQTTGDEWPLREAQRLLRPAVLAAQYKSAAYSTWACATATLLHPVTIHIRGRLSDPATRGLLHAARSVYRPYAAIRFHAPDSKEPSSILPPALAEAAELPAACVETTTSSPLATSPRALESLVRSWR